MPYLFGADFQLIERPDVHLMQQVYQLRARAWKARNARFPHHIQSWCDPFDASSNHFIACVAHDHPVAAARLTLASAIAQGPDAECYHDVPEIEYSSPIGFLSRLVVCPDYAGRGLSSALDVVRIKAAAEFGCKSLLVCSSSGEKRVRQLEGFGFKRLYIARVQATGALACIEKPTVLGLRLAV
jgi:GNAT superfamily N-acetyltransferase